MIRIKKPLAALFLIIVIIAMLFMLFVFPLLFDGYHEISLIVMIIELSILIFCVECLVKLFFGRNKREKNKLRFFYKVPL